MVVWTLRTKQRRQTGSSMSFNLKAHSQCCTSGTSPVPPKSPPNSATNWGPNVQMPYLGAFLSIWWICRHSVFAGKPEILSCSQFWLPPQWIAHSLLIPLWFLRVLRHPTDPLASPNKSDCGLLEIIWDGDSFLQKHPSLSSLPRPCYHLLRTVSGHSQDCNHH